MASKEKDKEKVSFVSKLLKHKKLVITLVVIGALVYAGYYFINRRKNGDVEQTGVKKGVVREELILSGEITADEHADLTFQSSGELDYIGVSEGDEVKKGQVLARLDTTNLYQSLQTADANLRAAAAALDVVYDDLQGKEDSETFAEKSTRTAAETAKDAAVFAHIQAQKNLVNATLKAPFDGIVTKITNPFTDFNFIYTQSQVEIVNPQTIHFEVTADQSEVVDLHLGQKVIIVLDSYSDEDLEGEISYIAYTPKAGEAGAVYGVKVILSQDEFDINKFRIGMTGDAKFVLEEKGDVLYLPPDFVNADNKGDYIKKGKINNKVYVDVGLEGEERVEVMGDVEEGDIVFD
jgi:HlyD family secretion protein